jgi:hypothetical protein
MQTRDPKLLPHALVFIALVLALALAHQWVNPWLRYDRAAVAGGEVWRLVTAHLVHLNLWHALLNLGGLVLILFFFRDLLDRRRFWLWFAVSAPLVGAVFFVLDRDLGWYVGLSGLLPGDRLARQPGTAHPGAGGGGRSAGLGANAGLRRGVPARLDQRPGVRERPSLRCAQRRVAGNGYTAGRLPPAHNPRTAPGHLLSCRAGRTGTTP